MDLSFTSYGNRIYYLPFVCTSLLPISGKFDRIFLTLDDTEPLLKVAFSRFVFWLYYRKRGEVLVRPSKGPHSKYFYYIKERWRDSPFVLIDDDSFYTRPFWRLILYCAQKKPSVIVGKRALMVSKKNEFDYSSFRPFDDKYSYEYLFMTNVGGVYYPAGFAQILKDSLGKHAGLCDRADDVWFYYLQVRHKVCVIQFQSFYNPFTFPASQGKALYKTNTINGYNSVQLTNVFREDPISA